MSGALVSARPSPSRSPTRRAAAGPDLSRFVLRRIGGLSVAAVDGDTAVAAVLEAMRTRMGLRVTFANAHCVNVSLEDADYREAMEGTLCLPDGIGVDLGSRLLFGEPFPENLNGTDFVPRLLAAAAEPLRVALVGGEPGVAERAAQRFAERFPQHRFTAVSHGFFQEGDQAEGVAALLRALKPDLLLVGLGVPRQEMFLHRHVGAREAAVAMGVGALLDFTAGKVARAPALVRRLRAEWVWRLLLEPRRLARRYIRGNPAFLLRVARQKIARGTER
ncbi:WecB/TagA/CpsF family glycosyltransferase [Aureimonas sp. AU4]|uniref:WecB/TagA/CpsF family glycosyltransferase n=1 Tax=Aureimonas sp. AU4 TaxID=1638163 RepID=UPI0009EAFA20|nr:WecB/TagA/CpsF family glycosyltransferase [Aureimonas sp. AU4]